MRDIATLFREYARLDLKRLDRGLSIRELERWMLLKQRLDDEFRSHGAEPERRRSSPRVATRLTCSYASRHEFGEAVITNLATGGVFIHTTTPLPVGAPVELKIQLRDAGSEIDVSGVVVSNDVGPRLEPGSRGMGVRFSRVGEDVIERIGALYAKELQRERAEAEGMARKSA